MIIALSPAKSMRLDTAAARAAANTRHRNGYTLVDSAK